MTITSKCSGRLTRWTVIASTSTCSRLDVGIFRGDLVEHLAEEGVAAQHIGLVAAGHAPPSVGRRAVAPARQFEGEAHDPLDALAGLDERIDRDLLAQQRAGAASGVEAFAVLAHDHIVDRLGVAQRRGNARIELDRTHIGVEIEPEAQRQREVEAGFRAVGMDDAGNAGGAVQDRVGIAATLESSSRGRNRRSRRNAARRRDIPTNSSGRSAPKAASRISSAALHTSGPMPSPWTTAMR